MEPWVHQSQERKQTFHGYLGSTIVLLTDNGSHSGRIPWNRFDSDHKKQLTVTQQNKLEMAEPDDNWMHFTYYFSEARRPSNELPRAHPIDSPRKGHRDHTRGAHRQDSQIVRANG